MFSAIGGAMPYLLYVIEVRNNHPLRNGFIGQFPLAVEIQHSSMDNTNPAALKKDLDHLCAVAIKMAKPTSADEELYARAIGAPTYIP